MIWGARASLLAGVVSVAIAVALGVPLGLVAGYFGGWIDGLISRFTDAMLAFPFLILAIALAAFLGPSLDQRDDRDRHRRHADLRPAHARPGAGGQGGGLRRGGARGRQLRTGGSRCATSCRTCCRRSWCRRRSTIAAAIIAEASLSFLGLGQQPPAPSWGSMLNAAQRFMSHAPWMAVWPGLAIFLTVLSFNLLGDGLRDALDPRSK